MFCFYRHLHNLEIIHENRKKMNKMYLKPTSNIHSVIS